MLACVAAASGMKIYEETQRSIEEMAGRINGRFSQIDWVPVRFSTRRIPYDEMVAWFCHADVCWITPLRDGLNLVAKEYAAARRNRGGVLVLLRVHRSIGGPGRGCADQPLLQSPHG